MVPPTWPHTEPEERSLDAGAHTSGPSLASVVDRAGAVGLQRLLVVAWRDRDDAGAGGSELHLSTILAAWRRAGLDLVLRTGAVAGQPARVDRDGYPTIRRGGAHGTFVRTPLAEIVKRTPADGLVEVWHGLSFAAPLWNRRPSVAIAHHVHQHQFGQVLPGPLARIARVAEAKVYPRLYRRTPIVTLSESARSEFAALGYDPAMIHVASPGVSEAFVPGRAADRPTLLTVGRLMPQKRVATIIELAATLRRDHPDLELDVVGDGPLRPEVEALIDRVDGRRWIRLRSSLPVEQLVELYQRAWVVVSASEAEGWGMSLSEAAATGTPTVATDISGHRDVVIDGRTGVLVRSDADLVAETARLLGDAALRSRLGDAAIERAQELTWDRCAAGTLEPLVVQAEQAAQGTQR
ncbi:MAG: glycosyltransferase family 4 protein [Acidimicrobiales bacterium]|nr:glycosyltransferase family 4 protein [Acidimicrobiales bacterium]